MTRSMTDQRATSKQLAALKNFDAKIPDELDKEAASAWIDHLVTKLKDGQEITAVDLSGPPSFKPASRVPTPPPSPPPLPSAAGEKTPAPSSAAPPNGLGPEPVRPSPDDWITCEVDSNGHRVVRIAAHAGPGETFDGAAARILSIALRVVVPKVPAQ
jgi:hypothetical protein